MENKILKDKEDAFVRSCFVHTGIIIAIILGSFIYAIKRQYDYCQLPECKYLVTYLHVSGQVKETEISKKCGEFYHDLYKDNSLYLYFENDCISIGGATDLISIKKIN
jgi:hypothetical protein